MFVKGVYAESLAERMHKSVRRLYKDHFDVRFSVLERVCVRERSMFADVFVAVVVEVPEVCRSDRDAEHVHLQGSMICRL